MSVSDVTDAESEGDNIHERLHKFDFTNNTKFLQGWHRVKQAIPAESVEQSLLKAQVYFFSREVEKVDVDAYKQWLQTNNKNINTDLLKEQKPTDDQTKDIKTASENSDTDTSSQGRHPANFLELVEMIEKGMKLPDTEDLNIEPLNVEPAPCQLERLKKPWEIA